MAASVTLTETNIGPVRRVKWAMTADASGDFSGASVSSGQTVNVFNGRVIGLTTVGGAGSSAPSASFDITVDDGSSIDVTMGQGGSRAATTEHTPGTSMGAVAHSKLTLNASGLGANNTATAYLWLR